MENLVTKKIEKLNLNEKKNPEISKLQEKLSFLINNNGSKEEIEELTLKIEEMVRNEPKNPAIEAMKKAIEDFS